MGNVIEVKSTGSFREQGLTCGSDCGILSAQCSTPPLPAGTYEVRHGTDRLTITIPSTVPRPCAGMATRLQ
jgi:hypothetical protein